MNKLKFKAEFVFETDDFRVFCFGKFDFIFSRNMLIYFDKETKLKAKGILTTIRASRGLDIDAACGLLSTKAILEQQKFEFKKV